MIEPLPHFFRVSPGLALLLLTVSCVDGEIRKMPVPDPGLEKPTFYAALFDHDGDLNLFAGNGAVSAIESLLGQLFPSHQPISCSVRRRRAFAFSVPIPSSEAEPEAQRGLSGSRDLTERGSVDGAF